MIKYLWIVFLEFADGGYKAIGAYDTETEADAYAQKDIPEDAIAQVLRAPYYPK